MLEDLHRKPRSSPIPFARICIWLGVALNLAGYALMFSVSPDNDMKLTIDRVFLATGLIAAGAALWLGGFFFRR
jgi:hypothetical protein